MMMTSDVVQAGTLFVNKKDSVTFHTYMAPDDSFGVTSQIIETANSLVLVDAQIFLPFASEVRAYADSLGKPIERMFISHMHPDHWLGLELFEDVPLYTTANVQTWLDASAEESIAQLQALAGTELVSSKKIVPDNTVAAGSEEIDGLPYEYEIVENAEAPEHLLIRLPTAGTVVAQDLVYNKTHLYLGNNTFSSWANVLSELKTLTAYDTVLAGHGAPSGVTTYDEDIVYLETAQGVLDAGGTVEDLRATMLEEFPDISTGGGLFDVSLGHLTEALG